MWMDLEEFKELVRKTWNTELSDRDRRSHAVLTVTTEAAEVADIWKKVAFSNRPDKNQFIDMMHLAEEIGDVLYGVLAVCKEFGVDPEFCMGVTAAKLRRRYNES